MSSLAKFFFVTFAITWAFFFAAIGLSHEAVVRGVLVFAGSITPAFVAFAMSTRADGAPATKALQDGLFQWRVGARWYLFAIGYMAAIRFTVAVADRVITGSWPQFAPDSPGMVVTAIVFSTPFQAGEEVGWRGYALPRLAARLGFARASVALGIVWACWHLPLFFLSVPGNDEYGQSFPVWALGVTGLSVAMAWLYAHTRGSLLLTMLMHSAVNNIPHFVLTPVADARNTFSLRASLVTWLTTVFLWIAAACLLPGMRARRDQGSASAMSSAG